MPYSYSCSQCKKTVQRRQKKKGKEVFCDRTCQSEHRKSFRHNLVCLACGKHLSRPKCQDKHSKTFCSIACCNPYLAASRVYPTKSLTKTCPVCLSEFTIVPSKDKSYIHCSRACKAKSTSDSAKAIFTGELICKRCGKLFHIENAYRRSYCSRECRYPSRLPRDRMCPGCGIEFDAKDPRLKFCTPDCYKLHRKQSGLETDVGQMLDGLGIFYFRQVRFGRFVVDFLIPHRQIVLEADGVYWHEQPAVRERDARKNLLLESLGWCLVRITDEDLKRDPLPYQLIRERITIPRLMAG